LLASLTAALLAACSGGSSAADNGVIITPIAPTIAEPTQPPTQGPTAVPADPTRPSQPNESTNASLHGFTYPIVGGCLPRGDQLMPNAPRPYRNGTHEGVDFYGVDNCTAISKGTPVVAAKAGRVIRADLDYVNITSSEVALYQNDPSNPVALDKFRGRQVWIDHGNGIVTRYCHLSDIAAGVSVGAAVAQGQLIAHVGNSGTPESILDPNSEMHLHFELRIGESFLGAGQPAASVRSAYVTLFGP
jgi:murein DD-endopeptidase MepM/ murein hydrolase activator NlpD